MKKATGKLAKVSGKNAKVDSKLLYDEWANDYDNDLINEYGYIAPKLTVDKFKALVLKKNLKIIDVGCGTGLVGQALYENGYKNIDGYDISSEMLKIAKQSKFYKELKQIDLNDKPTNLSETYDVLICVGSFGYGALEPIAIRHLIGLVKSGGLLFIFMNAEPFKSQNYQKHISKLETQSLWSVNSIDDYNYMSKLDRPGKLIIATKN
jgi:predicted TPR repeat methyltransferase